jgi:hypothetical protein
MRCRLWVVAHNRKLMAILLLMCIALPALTYQTPKGMQYPLVYAAFYFLILTVLMIIFNVAFLVAFHAFWVLANKNRGVVGDHEIEIRDDGLIERTPVNESLHRWTGFHKIGASRHCIYVFVTDNIVHYIPVRAFASQAEADSFRMEIQRRAHVA